MQKTGGEAAAKSCIMGIQLIAFVPEAGFLRPASAGFDACTGWLLPRIGPLCLFFNVYGHDTPCQRRMPVGRTGYSVAGIQTGIVRGGARGCAGTIPIRTMLPALQIGHFSGSQSPQRRRRANSRISRRVFFAFGSPDRLPFKLLRQTCSALVFILLDKMP